MAEIKSALEIALERTQDVEANKEALEANTFMTEGKKAVSKFLSEENVDLKKLLEGLDKKHLRHIKEGALQALLANLKLPLDEVSLLQSKNILKLHHGGAKPLTLDSWKLDNFKAMVAFVEQHVPPEAIEPPGGER